MSDYQLETPDSWDSIYSARGEEIEDARPPFTGDVYDAEGSLLMLVQHPCALRRGVAMYDRLLVVKVKSSGKPRSNWAAHAFTEMPLPELNEEHYIGDFTEVDIIESTSLQRSPRLAVLSQLGVNLLLQRWVYHCSRVVVPTITYDEQTYGPYNEADLAQEWITDHPETDVQEALEAFDAWVRETAEPGQRTRQRLLADRQAASAVRQAMRKHLRTLG